MRTSIKLIEHIKVLYYNTYSNIQSHNKGA
nr:MAG TPA: hypothetical protein [Caudoviricetes sp.]